MVIPEFLRGKSYVLCLDQLGPAAELIQPETLSGTCGVPVQLRVAEDGVRVFGVAG